MFSNVAAAASESVYTWERVILGGDCSIVTREVDKDALSMMQSASAAENSSKHFGKINGSWSGKLYWIYPSLI